MTTKKEKAPECHKCLGEGILFTTWEGVSDNMACFECHGTGVERNWKYFQNLPKI